jgi:hypothetical protein
MRQAEAQMLQPRLCVGGDYDLGKVDFCIPV